MVCNERLSILSELITMARADGVVKIEEHNFLLKIANQLNIDKNTFYSLFFRKVEKVQPTSKLDCIVQFYRLALLMVVDQELSPEEVSELSVMGLGLGLRASTIMKVLNEMEKYPDMVIPPEVFNQMFSEYN